jgi:ABC-2 type transport system permease protein
VLHPYRALLGLDVRLARRGALLMAVGLGVYSWFEIASFRSAYPNGVSMVEFEMFRDNPAVRMMNGVPDAIDTAGGFAVWDYGWMIQLLVAVWAILTTSRLLRGEEDQQRAELVLAGRVRAQRVTAAALVVVAAAVLVQGVTVAAAMTASDAGVTGSVLLGLGLAGVGVTFGGVAAVTSQLVDVNRRSAGLAAAALGVAYVLRMVGNSTDDRSWVRWLTPLGWMDELKPYGDSDLRALVPMVAVPLILLVGAVVMRARRDTGGALLAPEAGRAPRLGLLGSPAAFAWRTNRAVLLAWFAGLGVYSAVIGALVTTMLDWIKGDEGYQRIMAEYGLGAMMSTRGFLAVMGVLVGVVVALQVAWRMGAARAEEASSRAEVILARPVSRVRWLGGHALLSLVGGVALLTAMGSAEWLGAVASGSNDITWGDATLSVLNAVPVVVFIGGLAVGTIGLAPRLTVGIPVTVTVVGYIITLLGPALHWPTWVINASPFTHLALVPVEPWAATAGLVLMGTGLVLAALGLLAFHRRDVVGG